MDSSAVTIPHSRNNKSKGTVPDSRCALAREDRVTWILSAFKAVGLPRFARNIRKKLRALAPRSQIFFLLGREAVDFDAHGFEFEACDFFVEINGNRVDLFLQR